MKLVPDGTGTWSVQEGDEPLARYRWQELRFSVSWKAYCFADLAERAIWREHSDDLDLAVVLDTLERDLRARGAVVGDLPERRELAKRLVDTYIHFPKPASLGC
jgi:hypothetical protein